MTSGSGVRAEFVCEGQPRSLAPEAEESLLRIGQEALTNTLKHAQAGRFSARLAFRAAEVCLEVRDDGRGFDPAQTNGGFGLAGMRERVSRLGGRLAIESCPGHGTRLRVSLPDQAAEAAAA